VWGTIFSQTRLWQSNENEETNYPTSGKMSPDSIIIIRHKENVTNKIQVNLKYGLQPSVAVIF
jgi:hypothetical protein